MYIEFGNIALTLILQCFVQPKRQRLNLEKLWVEKEESKETDSLWSLGM